MTAVALTLGGLRVLVLERLPAASTALKAMSLGPLASEALQRRGLAAAVAAAEARSLAAMQEFTARTGADLRGADLRGRAAKFSGHFAGLLIRKDAQREPERRARAVGIEVRRACDVTSLVPRADGVDVAWASPTGVGHIRCAYLVGCDGGRSPIRKLAGFAFPGTAPTSTFYQVIAEVDRPERLLPVGWNRTPGGVFSSGPIPGRLFMLDFTGPPEDRQAPVTREEVEAVLRRVSGTDVRVHALESDAYVAWAGEERRTHGLEDALRLWFAPTPDEGSIARSGP